MSRLMEENVITPLIQKAKKHENQDLNLAEAVCEAICVHCSRPGG